MIADELGGICVKAELEVAAVAEATVMGAVVLGY